MSGEEIALTCLGSGAALGHDRLWSSILLDDRILVGLPPTVIPQLYRLGKDPTAIDIIFTSHFHADHFFGLPFFLLLYAYLYQRKAPLHIVGPSGLPEMTQRLYNLAWPKSGRSLRVPLHFIEVKEEGSYQAGEVPFVAVKMNHFGVESYGYRLSYHGRKIAFTGDTGDCPQLERLLAEADLLITEFTHPGPSNDAGHLNADVVTRLTARMCARGGKIIATHLGGHPAPIPGLTFCRDGETYLV